MNILTKICVVLLTVATIVASIFFINLATNNNNWKSCYEQEVTKRVSFEQSSYMFSEQIGQQKIELARLSQELSTLKAKNATSQNSHNSEIASKSETITKLRSDIDRINAHAANLANNITAKDNEIKSLLATIAGFKKDVHKYSLSLQKEQNVNKTLDSKRKIAENNVRILQVRVADLQSEIQRLREQLKNQSGSEDKEAVVLPEVKGTVIATSGNLVTINVGSEHGIKKGRKLMVYRKGGKLVGYITIQTVDTDEATGIITDKVLNPRKNDKVTSEF